MVGRYMLLRTRNIFIAVLIHATVSKAQHTLQGWQNIPKIE